jgi:TrpR-related protein YerC/YecD
MTIMTKISRIKLDQDDLALLIGQLWKAFTLLETKDEVHKFLHDILTRTEIQMLAKRLEVVKMLREGHTYDLIRKRLNVSDVTIAKINNWYQAFGEGYNIVIDRLHQIEKSRLPKDRPITPASVRAAQEVWVGSAKELTKLYKKHRKRRSVKH